MSRLVLAANAPHVGPAALGSLCCSHSLVLRREPVSASQVTMGVIVSTVSCLAQVGDTIQILFRNRARFPTSMHPHGVLYDKASEGTPYSDGTSGARCMSATEVHVMPEKWYMPSMCSVKRILDCASGWVSIKRVDMLKR